MTTKKKHKKIQQVKAKEPLFDMHSVLEEFKDVEQPRNEEEAVGVLLRVVREHCDKNNLTEYGVVELQKSPEKFVFGMQGIKDKNLINFDITIELQPQKAPLQYGQHIARWSDNNGSRLRAYDPFPTDGGMSIQDLGHLRLIRKQGA